MPVNMDPQKRRTFSEEEQASYQKSPEYRNIQPKKFDKEKEKDRERKLADAEAINLIGSDQGYG